MNQDSPVDAAYFCIEVEGIVDARWQPRLGGLDFQAVARAGHSTTRMAGWLVDQAQLHAVLTAICDLGLVLLSVQRFAEQPQTT